MSCNSKREIARALADSARLDITRDEVFSFTMRYLGIGALGINGRALQDDLAIGLTPAEVAADLHSRTSVGLEPAAWAVAAASAAFNPARTPMIMQGVAAS